MLAILSFLVVSTCVITMESVRRTETSSRASVFRRLPEWIVSLEDVRVRTVTSARVRVFATTSISVNVTTVTPHRIAVISSVTAVSTVPHALRRDNVSVLRDSWERVASSKHVMQDAVQMEFAIRRQDLVNVKLDLEVRTVRSAFVSVIATVSSARS